MRVAEARGLLCRAQRLYGPERDDGAAVAEVVRAVGALQAQDLGAAALGVRARLAGATAAAVADAPGVVRGWFMRGTLHWVHADDAGWMHALLAPVGLRRSRRRRAELRVDSDAAVQAVRAALDGGPLDRHALAEAVRARGVEIADDPQAPAFLVAHAWLEGAVVEAGRRGGQALYALAGDARLGAAAPPDPAAELARRFVRAFPPAGPADMARWSGLPAGACRRAFAAVAADFEASDDGALVPPGLEPAAEGVRLLGAFDSVFLCHSDRSLTVAPEHERLLLPGGGVLRPTLLVGGRFAGTWRLVAGRVEVSPVARLTGPEAERVAAEAADVERFRA